MCISSDDYVVARVTNRLLKRGVDPKRAEAIGRKVGRRYRDARESRYRSYLAGVQAAQGARDE